MDRLDTNYYHKQDDVRLKYCCNKSVSVYYILINNLQLIIFIINNYYFEFAMNSFTLEYSFIIINFHLRSYHYIMLHYLENGIVN